jgi:Phosphotransferase enzyme family
MFLSSKNLIPYLLQRRFITPEAVVDGGIMIVDSSSRNNNFKVILRDAPGYFVKQARTWEQQTVSSLQMEATCYWLAHNDPSSSALQEVIPKYFDYDASRHILTVELLQEGENLSEYHRRLGMFPTEIAEQLGVLLRRYHQTTTEIVEKVDRQQVFRKQAPWILSVHQSNHLTGLSAANSQLIQIVQRYPEFHQALNALRSQWRVRALIHGDIKWDNCVLFQNGNAIPQMKLVDWELADFGDPLWDAGAVLQAYLSFWILSLLPAADANPESVIRTAPYPLEKLHPAIRSFWESYSASLPDDEKNHALTVAVQYAAARMIQTAFEYMHQSPQLSANAVYILQVSMNVLTNPKDAIRNLFQL